MEEETKNGWFRRQYEKKYMDLLVGVAVIVGVIIALFSLCAVQDQLELTENQARLSQTQLRLAQGPALTVKPISHKDTEPYSGSIRLVDTTATADSARWATVKVSVDNIGKSNAVLDTVYFEMVSTKYWVSQGTDLNGAVIFPDQALRIPCPIKLDNRASVQVMRIVCKYRWEFVDVQTESQTLDRAYSFTFDADEERWSALYEHASRWTKNTEGKTRHFFAPP